MPCRSRASMNWGRDYVLNMVRKASLQGMSTYHFGLLPVLDEKARIPGSLIPFIEENSSKLPQMVAASKCVIYVCGKEPADRKKKAASSYTL